MALSKTDAIHANALVAWLIDEPKPSGGRYTIDDIRRSAVHLAEKAHTALHAGVGPHRVEHGLASYTEAVAEPTPCGVPGQTVDVDTFIPAMLDARNNWHRPHDITNIAHATLAYMAARGVTVTWDGEPFAPGELSPNRFYLLCEQHGLLVDEG